MDMTQRQEKAEKTKARIYEILATALKQVRREIDESELSSRDVGLSVERFSTADNRVFIDLRMNL